MDRHTRELKALGERIRARREAAGLSQEELAALVNVKPRSIGNWERGIHHPRSSMGALERELGPLRAKSPARDPIEAAVETSDLTTSERHELLAVYYRIRERRQHADVG